MKDRLLELDSWHDCGSSFNELGDQMTAKTSKTDQTPLGELKSRYPEGYWDDKEDHLQQCFILQHNEDYLEFLVRRVWKLDQPSRLVEIGCGIGRMALAQPRITF